MYKISVIALIVAVDQLLKLLFFKSSYLNSGIAFGFFEGNAHLVTLLYTLAFILLAGFWIKQKPKGFGWVFLLAGILSNLIDRVRVGAVVDYLIVGNFPAFNLADILIIGGASLIFLSGNKNQLRKTGKSV